MRGRLSAGGACWSTVDQGQVVQGGAAVDRAAETVEHAAAQRVADVDAQGAAGVADMGADREAVGEAHREADQAAGPARGDLGQDGLGGDDLEEVARPRPGGR